MTNIPPLSDNVEQFLQAVEAGLGPHGLNLGVNFGLDFTDPDPDHGVGALFCQLNLKRKRVSQKRAKKTLLMVMTAGLVVDDAEGNSQILSFSDEQPPWMVGAMVAGALSAKKPLVAPTCPHCTEKRERELSQS